MSQSHLLHRKISLSRQVNSLPIPAQLLFSWMIAHADDDGRLAGDAGSVRVTVIPWHEWSNKDIEDYLMAMDMAELIYLWDDEEYGGRVIEFVNWLRYQRIRADRYKPSIYPKYNHQTRVNRMTTSVQPMVVQSVSQLNESKEKPIKNKQKEERFDIMPD